MPSICTIWRCGETKPIWSQTHLGSVAVHLTGQVVTFVEDHQAPAIAQTVHMIVGTVIRGDSQVLRFIIAAANQTNLLTKCSTEQIVPLIHQVNGWCND